MLRFKRSLLKKILGCEGVWISDESSLWDFATERTLESYFVRIQETYGVDVPDVKGALLWKILKRIAERV
jgi:hypothetical protein